MGIYLRWIANLHMLRPGKRDSSFIILNRIRIRVISILQINKCTETSWVILEVTEQYSIKWIIIW